MNVSEWMERQGLTLDSEIPDSMMAAPLKVPKEMMDGLSEEDKTRVRTLAVESGDMDIVSTYISWLRAGDVAMFNTGSTVTEALTKIERDFGSIYYNEKLVPVKPLEYFSFRYTIVSDAVAMRFTKVK